MNEIKREEIDQAIELYRYDGTGRGMTALRFVLAYDALAQRLAATEAARDLNWTFFEQERAYRKEDQAEATRLRGKPDIEQLWKQMEEMNAGVMKLVFDAHSVERSRAMILIDGVDEVQEIVTAIEAIEETWEAQPSKETPQ